MMADPRPDVAGQHSATHHDEPHAAAPEAAPLDGPRPEITRPSNVSASSVIASGVAAAKAPESEGTPAPVGQASGVREYVDDNASEGVVSLFSTGLSVGFEPLPRSMECGLPCLRPRLRRGI